MSRHVLYTDRQRERETDRHIVVYDMEGTAGTTPATQSNILLGVETHWVREVGYEKYTAI